MPLSGRRFGTFPTKLYHKHRLRCVGRTSDRLEQLQEAGNNKLLALAGMYKSAVCSLQIIEKKPFFQ